MSLGNIGLTGGLIERTNANIVIWASKLDWIGTTSASQTTLTGVRDIITSDDRFNHGMPFAGKFTQLLFMEKTVPATWNGSWFLQKNNVDTALQIFHNTPTNVIDKITVDVPFVKGDLFRIRGATLSIGQPRECAFLLLGGFDIP